jgi:hypothetical protein
VSVLPVKFNADGSVDVVHGDAPGGSHGGTVSAGALSLGAFSTLTGGGQTHNAIGLPCPVAGCGAVSFHPIGGGAEPAAVQELFVRVVARVGCPCGQLTAGKPIAIVQAHVKLQTERMDGVGRWAAGVLH